MKKLLALVLALVMTLGLATVGTNAANWSDLKDTDKVAADREEAFQVLNAIQVIEGDNEGNLNPDKQLTRAEAAAIIARLNLGKTTAESLTGVGSKFTDVPANFWDGKGAGYIEYCASTGIIAGRGDGTFDPNGDLTVAAFAKMLLVSLGYSAETEKFLGPDWQINVMSLANRAGLFAGASSPVATDKVNRADAALFAFNTLKTPLVTYGWSGSNMVPAGFAVGQTSAIYDTTNARDTQTISRALANDGTAKGTYLVEFAERHFPALVRDSHDTDEWGNPCTTWTLNRNKIDSYKNETMRVMSETKTITSAAVYKAIGAELLVRMANNVAGESFLFNVYVDGVPATTDQVKVIRAAILKNDTTKLIADKVGLGLTGPGTLFEVFVDDQSYWDDGYSNKITAITLVTTHTWLAEVTADMNNNGLGLNTYMDYTADNGGTAMKAKKDVVPEDMTSFKEGEKVLVQMTYPDDNTGKRTVRHVLPAELSNDTYVSGYQSAGGLMATIRVDEEDHDLADKCYTNSDILKNYTLQQLRNYTYDVWNDQYGNVIGIEFNKTDTDYVFVTGFETNSSYLTAGTVKVNAIWPNGTMENIQVATTDNGTARDYLQDVAQLSADKKGCATINTWFTYSKADNGAVVLDNAIGYYRNGKSSTESLKVNQASIALNDPAGNVEISSVTPTLKVTDNLVAFGNDKTVYITAEAQPYNKCGIEGGAIAKVNGVVTGIKNARIDTTPIGGTGLENFGDNEQNVGYEKGKTGLQNYAYANANVYFVYNTNTGYVLYAVVLSESKGGDVVYVIEQTRRDYVKGVGYVDTYDAIVNGKADTILVDCTKSGTNDDKLHDGELYVLRKDGDYYVHCDETTENTLFTNNNAKYGYVKVLGLDNDTKKVTLKENTLYIEKKTDNQNYFLTNGETVYFVGNTTNGFVKYTSAGAALAAGNVTNKSYIANVYADCNTGTGVASTVVFVTKAITAATPTVVKNATTEIIETPTIVGTSIPVKFYGDLDNKQANEDKISAAAEQALKDLGYTINQIEDVNAAGVDGQIKFTVTDKNGVVRVLTTAPTQVYLYSLNGTEKYLKGTETLNWTEPTSGTGYIYSADGETWTYSKNNVDPNGTGKMNNDDLYIKTGYVKVTNDAAPHYVSVNGGDVKVANSGAIYTYTVGGVKADEAITAVGTKLTIPAVTKDVVLTRSYGLFVDGELVEVLVDGSASTAKWSSVTNKSGTGLVSAQSADEKYVYEGTYATYASKTGTAAIVTTATNHTQSTYIWTGFVKVTGADTVFDTKDGGIEATSNDFAPVGETVTLKVGDAGKNYRVDATTAKGEDIYELATGRDTLTYEVGDEDITVTEVFKMKLADVDTTAVATELEKMTVTAKFTDDNRATNGTVVSDTTAWVAASETLVIKLVLGDGARADHTAINAQIAATTDPNNIASAKNAATNAGDYKTAPVEIITTTTNNALKADIAGGMLITFPANPSADTLTITLSST